MNIAVINDIIKNNPILDHPTQLELVSDWQKNKVKPSLDKLVLSNMRIVSREAFLLKRRKLYILILLAKKLRFILEILAWLIIQIYCIELQKN